MNPVPEIPLVFIVDDDASVRRSLARMLDQEGYAVETFNSAHAYLDHPAPAVPACVVLDVRMPGLNGLDLQQTLTERGRDDQIVFITGHGDVPMCARAMKAGAVDFLPKPFSDDDLLAAIGRAVTRSRTRQQKQAVREQARARLALLTPRELEVFRHVIAGRLNKQIGATLGTAERTVKVHRGQITAKLGVTAVADMVRLAQQAGVPPAPAERG